MSNLPYYPNFVRENVGLTPATTQLTSVTLGGSSSGYGAYDEFVSELTVECEYGFFLTFNSNNIAENIYIDIACGDSGSEQVIVEAYPFVLNKAVDTQQICEFIPVRLPKGERIAVRGATANGVARTYDMMITPIQGDHRTPKAYSGYKGWFDTSDNRGYTVDAGASANTLGAWTEIVSSTTDNLVNLQVWIDENDNASLNFYSFQSEVGIGDSGSEVALASGLAQQSDGAFDIRSPYRFSVGASVPSGSRLAVRIQSSTTDSNDRKSGVSIGGYIL